MAFLFWRRPATVVRPDGFLQVVGPSDVEKGAQSHSHNQFGQLSLDSVVCNKLLPPCTLPDFLDYLSYVSAEVETLQFYLWMVDYFERFRNSSRAERALSPRWTGHAPPIREQKGHRMIAIRDIDLHSEDVSNCSTWGAEIEMSEFSDDFVQTLDDIKFSMSPIPQFQFQRPNRHQHFNHNPDAYQWFQAENQPFRTEISRIINHYLLPGAPRQLNLSHNDRATVLRALEYTTHPSALRPIKAMLDSNLRNHSHPNFVRWSLCNINSPYRLFLIAISSILVILGLLIALLLTLSHVSRFARLLCVIPWTFGFVLWFAALQRFCPIHYRLRSRQARPWEMGKISRARTFEPRSPDADDEIYLKADHVARASISFPARMEIFGPSNNFAGEAWVHEYEQRSWLSSVFERRVPVAETSLIEMQKRMEVKAYVWGGLATLVTTIIFVAIPPANIM